MEKAIMTSAPRNLSLSPVFIMTRADLIAYPLSEITACCVPDITKPMVVAQAQTND
jgi:hypothetical protein